MKIKYSPDASDKLRQIKKIAGTKITGEIIAAINGLLSNPRKCPTVENMLGITNPYYFLHVEQNYVFYRIEESSIVIVNIFNDREDFMYQLFGIKTISDDTIDYWGE